MNTSLWLILFALPALAKEGPKWAVSPTLSDSNYKYYVGRAFEETSEVVALRQAREQAQEAAIRENFGVETMIATSSYESEKQVGLDRRVSELLPKVRLIDFEQVDSFVEQENGFVNVWLLFRYPIAQIEKEKVRLIDSSKASANFEPLEFNQAGSALVKYSTNLEITSEPIGVEVFIDDERWGVTPLRLTGVIKPGSHKLKLDHENYKCLSSDLILLKGEHKKIHQTLRPATGFVLVTIEPKLAQVIVSGEKRQTATGEVMYEVPAGPSVQIVVGARGYDTQIHLVDVEKDQTKTVYIILNSKKTIGQESAAPATSSYKAEAIFNEPEGHQKGTQFGILFGLSEPSAQKGLGLSTGQLGLTLEKRFLWRLGVRVGVTYDFATESTRTSDKTNELALDGSGTFIGVPFYFSSSPKGYFLMAETGQIRHRRLKEVLDPNVTSIDPEFIELKAHRTGARIGYVDLSQRYEWWLATHVYEWPGVGTVQATSIGFTLTWSDGGE